MGFLTSIVSAMRLSSALYARLEATAPWGVQFASGQERARFGLVTVGRCWLLTDAVAAPRALVAGECFLLLDPASYSLSDNPQGAKESCKTLMETHSLPGTNLIRFGGGGTAAAVITGWFGFDTSTSRLLLDLLPKLMLFRLEDERSDALQATLDLLTIETARSDPGGELVIRSLADVLFVQAVRAYMASSPQSQTGLLAALADPQLGKAINAMHADAAHRWTVAALANVCGMSRSSFALRFQQVVGQTPLEYLSRWRMNLAMSLMLEKAKPLSSIALDVGYETESSFSKAFQRTTGMTPSSYRRSRHDDFVR